jgi:hypothetical protein
MLQLTRKLLLLSSPEWRKTANSANGEPSRILLSTPSLARLVACRFHCPSQASDVLINIVTKSRFRWVACQLDALQKCRSVNELHQTLHSLPKTLELTHERILSQIDENDHHRARALLYWLAYREFPHNIFDDRSSWTLPEIAEAVAMTPDKNFEPRDRLQEPRELLDIASSLISVDKPSSLISTDKPPSLIIIDPDDFHYEFGLAMDVETVQLAHASVLEYLKSARLRNSSLSMFHISPEKGHAFLAKSCLRYLLSLFNFSIEVDDYYESRRSYPMLGYAAETWGFHLRQVQVDTKSIEEIHVLALKILDVNRRGFWNAACCSISAGPLDFALQNNLPRLFKDLIDNGHDPCEEEGLDIRGRGGLLKFAIRYNQTLVAETLFRRKVYLDQVGRETLQDCVVPALLLERSKIVSLLINHLGKAITLTPVTKAMQDGRCTEALRLVSSGIPINTYSKWGDSEGTPLSYAVYCRQLPLVVSFLESGADPTLEIQQAKLPGGGSFRGPVLPLAFLMGLPEIFDVLCSTGRVSIDATFTLINDGFTFVGNLLLHQTIHPNLAKMLVLLGKGPDLETELELSHEISDELGTGTALHNTILQGKGRLLELLLGAGANPNAPCYIRRGDHTIALAPFGLW